MAKSDPVPQYVIDGTFVDHEWRETCLVPEWQRTRAQKRIYQAGPRLHPYGPLAVRATIHGVLRWFPSLEAAKDFAGDRIIEYTRAV